MVAVTVAAFLAIRSYGETLTAPLPASAAADATPGGSGASSDVLMHVLIALVAVIAVGQILARLFAYIDQPPVIGEVMAGILLGPSLLGSVSPAAQTILPPQAVAPYLAVISQFGVILYMFIVGLELNAGLIKGRARAAVATSHASIVVPFLLGTLWPWGSIRSLSAGTCRSRFCPVPGRGDVDHGLSRCWPAILTDRGTEPHAAGRDGADLRGHGRRDGLVPAGLGRRRGAGQGRRGPAACCRRHRRVYRRHAARSCGRCCVRVASAPIGQAALASSCCWRASS